MNKERILDLATFFESGRADKHFNMRVFIGIPDKYSESSINDIGEDIKHDNMFSCNTVACIAGWTVLKYSENHTITRDLAIASWELERQAMELLDIDEDSTQLFYPNNGKEWGDIKPSEAAKVLRHFAETEIVNWSLV